MQISVHKSGLGKRIASACTCLLSMILFEPEGRLNLNRKVIRHKLDELGKLITIERKTILWVSVDVILLVEIPW